jgi:drug/metabolite transporter (DMT)-like permease
MKRPSLLLSYIALLIFASFSAWRDVRAKSLVQSLGTVPAHQKLLFLIFLVWFASAVTLLLLYLFNSILIGKPYKLDDIRQSPGPIRRDIILLNIGTLIAFITALVALNYLSAYATSILDYGLMPAVAVVIALALKRIRRVSGGEWIGIAVCLVGVTLLAISLINDEDSSKWYGVILSLISAVAGAANQVLVGSIIKSGVSPLSMMVVRSPLMVITLGITCIALHVPVYSKELYIGLTTLSIAGFVVPLFMVAYAFRRLGIVNVASAIFLIPVFSFIGSWFSGALPKGMSLAWAALAGVTVLAGVYISEKSTAEHDSEPLDDVLESSGGSEAAKEQEGERPGGPAQGG